MVRGSSGRVVIEVDPELKSELYTELAKRQLTLKAWFMAAAQRLIEEEHHPTLASAEALTAEGLSETTAGEKIG